MRRWERVGDGGSLGRTPFPLTRRENGTCGAWRPTRRVLKGVMYGEMGGALLEKRSLVRLRPHQEGHLMGAGAGGSGYSRRTLHSCYLNCGRPGRGKSGPEEEIDSATPEDKALLLS